MRASYQTILAMHAALIPRAEHRDASLINGASLDLRLGRHFLPVNDIRGPYEADELRLHPGQFVLGRTLERVVLPPDYAGNLYLKSTMGRLGIDHALAGYVDPGWDGVLTLELRSNLNVGEIVLRAGEPVVQLVLDRVDFPTEKPYAGRYQHAVSVEGAKVKV